MLALLQLKATHILAQLGISYGLRTAGIAVQVDVGAFWASCFTREVSKNVHAAVF